MKKLQLKDIDPRLEGLKSRKDFTLDFVKGLVGDQINVLCEVDETAYLKPAKMLDAFTLEEAIDALKGLRGLKNPIFLDTPHMGFVIQHTETVEKEIPEHEHLYRLWEPEINRYFLEERERALLEDLKQKYEGK